MRRGNHNVQLVGSSEHPNCNYRSIWNTDFNQAACFREKSNRFFVPKAYTDDVGAHYGYCERAHGHANNIDNFVNADLKYFGSDLERIERDNSYPKIMGRGYSEQLSTIISILSKDLPGSNTETPINSNYTSNVALAIEKYVAGRALTSPTIIERFHSDGLFCPKTLLDCISIVAKTVFDNDKIISEMSSDIHNGEVSLNVFRDIFIERILARNSIGLSVDNLPDVPACMISVGNSRKIYRDKKLNGFERSFAVAHELAHFLFNDKSYLDIEFANKCSAVHTLQEYRSDQFANILLRSLEGIFISLGGQSTQRDYAKGMLDLAAGKRLLKRQIVDFQEPPAEPSKAFSQNVECDQQISDQEFAS
jgi:hypothetical protein